MEPVVEMVVETKTALTIRQLTREHIFHPVHNIIIINLLIRNVTVDGWKQDGLHGEDGQHALKHVVQVVSNLDDDFVQMQHMVLKAVLEKEQWPKNVSLLNASNTDGQIGNLGQNAPRLAVVVFDIRPDHASLKVLNQNRSPMINAEKIFFSPTIIAISIHVSKPKWSAKMPNTLTK